MTDRQLLQLAERTLTPNEYAAYELAHKGMSQRAIALHLNLSRGAIRARLENAQRKITLARKEQAA